MKCSINTKSVATKEVGMKLRVWWVPQVPMKAYYVDVSSVEEGVKIIDALAKYDLFQLANNIKPDYCNAGGLQMFDEEDKEDGPEGSWVDWCDYETGECDPEEYIKTKE
jgi:hypothetical protein